MVINGSVPLCAAAVSESPPERPASPPQPPESPGSEELLMSGRSSPTPLVKQVQGRPKFNGYIYACNICGRQVCRQGVFT